MKYRGLIYRPPLEVYSYLLPVTEGCSHAKCRFCSLYRNINFRLLTLEEIESRLAALDENHKWIERVYLVGADPFTLSIKLLEPIIITIKNFLPNVKVITMNATIKNIKTKTDRHLKRLKDLGVSDLYVEIDSGLDDVLKYFRRGNTVSGALEQCLRLNYSGIRHIDRILLGTAGSGRHVEAAAATAELLNVIKPAAIWLDVMAIFPDAKIFDDIKAKKFIPARALEMLLEEKFLLENLNLPETYLWANNGAALVGYLDSGRNEMLGKLQRLIDSWQKNLAKNPQR